MNNARKNQKSTGGLPRAVSFFAGTILCFFFTASAQIDSAANQRIFDAQLNELLKEVLSGNPSLKAAGYKVTAASASAAAKKSLDPPQAAVEFYQAPVTSFPNPLKNQMEIDYSLQQMFPFPGKLSSMSRAEKKRSEMLEADKQTLASDLIRDLKSAYYMLYLVDRRKEILLEKRDLLKNFEEIARKQYEVGMGSQSDILRGQTEVSLVVKDSIELEQNRISAIAMLNALRNKPTGAAIPSLPEIRPPSIEFTIDKIMPLAETNRPELVSMKLNTVMQQAMLNAAKKEFYPDFMVRGTYKQMTDLPDDWALMVGLSIPVAPWSLNKTSAGARSSEALVSQSTQDYNAMRNMVASQIQDALAKVESNQAQIQIIRQTIIPQATQTLQSVVAAYQTGKQDFLMLIDAERMLLMAKEDYHMAVMNLLASQAQLERAVGLSLDEIAQSLTGGRQ
ncbi:MAG: TolC family protein [Chitinispirillaceae bacterium]|jgi:outer membrane protein TolC